jgi:hypothetical protein
MNPGRDPHLTIVATSRNDDHGGDLLGRMQIFMDAVREQGARFGLDAELVLVEWNPPPERPRLADALTWPRFPGAPPVRFIEVPPEIHQGFPHADHLPLFQMAAKNVGIRRARGRFILATNIDIVLSDELVRLLAGGGLSDRAMYRVDRYDVRADFPSGISTEAVLEHCRNHVTRIHRKSGTFRPDGSPWRVLPKRVERKKGISLHPKHVAYRMVRGEWRPILVARRILGRILQSTPVKIHTNACGDFTLLSRERWHSLRGYPELPGRSLHVDSLLCFAAHHSGARERVLRPPKIAYHIEHSRDEGDTDFQDASPKVSSHRRPESQIPWVTYEQLRTWAIQMRRERRPIIFNDGNWGLAGEDLQETVL